MCCETLEKIRGTHIHELVFIISVFYGFSLYTIILIVLGFNLYTIILIELGLNLYQVMKRKDGLWVVIGRCDELKQQVSYGPFLCISYDNCMSTR